MKNSVAIFFFAFLFLGCFFIACSSPKQVMASALRQGVKGRVYEVSGNQMPSPDAPPPAPKGISTTVYIYELTNISQTERINTSPFYKTIRTRFIQSVTSDSTGYFSIALPAGNYSLFTKVDGRFYANNFDTANNIAAVTVEENKVSESNIKISAKAVY